ncbi:hypothetical protein V2J09_012374 [Rumex salicifolius]
MRNGLRPSLTLIGTCHSECYLKLAFIMATSSKFDLSAGSERPSYPSGPRGLYGGTSLDRSGSFRESMDNQILSSLPSMSRSNFRVTQGDVQSYFECLHFDPECVGSEKFQRLGELKKIANVISGILQDGSASGSIKEKLLSSISHEDVKKAKASLQESCDQARERVKIFSEALSMSKKFFPSIPLRKRSRTDAVTNDRTNFVPLNNRSGIGPRIMKMGAPVHAVMNETAQPQKSEERTKNTKRTRTSLLDPRANSLAKQCTLMDKDRNIGRGANSGIVLDNDHRPPTESWERSKMKKKRSVIKADVSPSKSSPKSADSHRELKQGVRQRLATDLTFRSYGTVGIGKLDGGTDSGVHPSIARVDHENGTLFGKERTSDKERVNLRSINKSGRREDYNSPSPSSSTKMIPSIRPPQLNKGILQKMSPSSQPPNSCSDWEISQFTNKPSAPSGSNKKRTSSVRSSSPPVTHWTGQRPQKILHPARRTNFLPVVSSNEETMSVDGMSDADNDNGFMFAKDFPSISAKQVKLKGEQFSESEDSGVAETKKETKKVKKIHSKADGRAGHNVKKASIAVLPAHKKKLISGDSSKRQGRLSRSLTSSRSLMSPTVDKLGNIAAAKQPRTSRTIGRPPMRKLSDRKAYTSNRLSALHAAADIDDDGQKELLAAAKAVVDPSHLSLFWRHMELMFRCISDADIGFLKQQDEVMCELNTQKVPTSADANGPGNCMNELAFLENMGLMGLMHPTEELIPDQSVHTTFPLCQRLIAALIIDGEDYGNGTAEEKQDSCETGYQMNAALESGTLVSGSEGNIYSAMSTTPNGLCSSVTNHSLHESEELDKSECPRVSIQNFGDISSADHMFDGLLPIPEIIPISECTKGRYSNMSLDERLLLEVQSLGISPEQQPEMRDMDNGEVSQEIRHLSEEYCQKVSKRRCFNLNLSKSALQSKECQESNFEQCALEKLVTMAYAKYMASLGARGPTGKMKQQNALAFVNRAIEHCQRYEATGISCFSEPLYKDIFSETLNKITEHQSVDCIPENEPSRDYPNTPLGLQQTGDLDSSGVPLQEPSSSELNTSKQEAWSNKMKKRHLLDAGNGLPVSSTKGKRSDRENGKARVGKTMSKSGTTKPGRPVSGSSNGDRKSKAKAKQKTTQLSTSVNDLLGKNPEKNKASFSLPSGGNTTNNNAKKKEDLGINTINDPAPKFSTLDVDLGGQGEDLASWLNIDDDSLQDIDFMGLEIPMDDLSEVNMMV